MATLLNRTDWSFAKSGTTVNWTVTIPACTAGSTLVMVGIGGAHVTAKITNTSGAAFTERQLTAGVQDLAIADFVTSGGETAVFLTLNGAENVAGTIYELSGLGAFIAGSGNTGTSPGAANDFQSKPSSAVTVATGNALLIGAWSVIGSAASFPANGLNQWRQMGPLGKLYVNSALQPGANTQFLYASGLADVTAAASYPAQLSAGQYQATSVWVDPTGSGALCAQAAYADSSGVATNPAPVNPVVAENSLPGTVSNNWFLGTAGTNGTIAGYCDKTSYAPGDTVNFKVDSTSNPFRVEIYRLGYYGWETFGARNVLGNQGGYITGTPAAQSAPTVDSTLGSTSCAWTTTATWAIPSNAPPGLYLVLFRRTDITTNVSSGHFIVRGSSAQGLPAVVLPDYTYQAYNIWGATTDNGSLGAGTWTGRSLYQIGGDGSAANFAHRAYAVSFDRPYSTHQTQANTYFLDAEQGLICFLEAQGYNLTYYSCKDLDDNTSLLNTAKAVLLIGHHEYWTASVYNCLTNARQAGVSFMICSSNTALWHTRFAAGDTNKRTMICYKDSGSKDVSAGFDAGTGFDPTSYTGAWRDSRTGVSPFNTDLRRENALTGQLFLASAHVSVSMTVPFAQKTLPAWRNSSSVQALTAGNSYSTPTGTIGDEVDGPDGSSGQPANQVNLCPTPAGSIGSGANANGTTYSATITPTVGFTLYRAASRALMFNTGQWRGWQGVSRFARSTNGSAVTTPDVNWQNAFLAVLYDLGLVPVAAREMKPFTDTALTSPATGAPATSTDKTGVTRNYGLTCPEDGQFMAAML